MTERADVDDCRTMLAWLAATAAAGGADAREVTAALQTLRAALDELRRRQLRPSTAAKLERLRKLAPLLRDYEPAERIAIVKQRCNVGTSRAYDFLAMVSDEDRKTACKTSAVAKRR